MPHYHEIALRGQIPLDESQLNLLGRICNLNSGTRLLDLDCGTGQLLVTWARQFEIMGVGVDSNEAQLEVAREDVATYEVSKLLNFVMDDPLRYPQDFHAFDMVSCMDAGSLGDDLQHLLGVMQISLKENGGVLLIGEPYWREDPPEDVLYAMDMSREMLTSLGGLLEEFESAGVELVEMLLPDQADFDRNESQQWMRVYQWLKDNLNDPDAPEIHETLAHSRRNYLTYGRRYLGWGVFVLGWG
ncbi:MAG: methyltransferase domain-containing protein [Aggregatilineales bacterium]